MEIMKKHKLNISAQTADLLSFAIGIMGFLFGLLSLLSLLKFWSDSKFSYDITIVAIVFDFASLMFACIAFKKSYQHLKSASEDAELAGLYKQELTSFCCDGFSIVAGLVGVVLEITSVIALSKFWYNEDFSYTATVTSLIFDFISTTLIIIAFSFITNLHYKVNILKSVKLLTLENEVCNKKIAINKNYYYVVDKNNNQKSSLPLARHQHYYLRAKNTKSLPLVIPKEVWKIIKHDVAKIIHKMHIENKFSGIKFCTKSFYRKNRTIVKFNFEILR